MSIDSIRARVEVATDGPWKYDPRPPYAYVWGPDGDAVARVWGGYFKSTDETFNDDDDNAEFIAHARTDIPLLLKVAEAAKEQVMWEGQICPWFPGLKHEDCERCGNAVLCAALAELETAE
jgi:hypothetical protein